MSLNLAGFTLLQVVPALDAGGVERTTLDIAAAVVRAGGRALVASRGGRLEPELAARGGELMRLPLDTRAPLRLMANAVAIRRLIARESVDIVHARSRAPAWSALWAARVSRTPFVTTYAGVYSGRSRLKRTYNSVMACGDAVIANSAYTRAHVLETHPAEPARVVAIPRGVDMEAFDPALITPARVAAVRAAARIAADDRRPILLCAGRLTRWKGQILAVEALARSTSAAILILAGDAQGRAAYVDELRRLVESRGLVERVRFAGHVVDMAAAYATADVVLAPSIRPEAFGRTAVEPQAMNRFVLAAAHGAPCETILDGVTGELVAPNDVGAWATAIDRAIDRARTCEGHGGAGAGRAHVAAHYSLEAMTNATLDLYRTLRRRAA